MAKLSVVVPVFNAEKYLEKCVSSIINQEYKDIEVILVDDGSKDKSGKICDDYAKEDKRVKVIHQENLGKIKARYRGILESSGEYITGVDADDWIDLDTYSKLLDAMTMNVDLIIYAKMVEKAGVGTYSFEKVYEEGIYEKRDIADKIMNTVIWNIEKNKPGLAQSLNDKIFKRELLLRSYGQASSLPKIQCGEDSIILYPILQWVNSMYITNNSMYHYRQHVGEIPQYFRDNSFFEKIYTWYEYLSKNVEGIPQGKKQLEYMYLYLLNMRKEVYGDIKKNDEYIFPFKKIPVNSKIVLYGAGKVGSTYVDQIQRSKYCELVAWVDSNYQKYSNNKIESPESIKNKIFDYIIIAIQSDSVKRELAQELQKLGYSVIV